MLCTLVFCFIFFKFFFFFYNFKSIILVQELEEAQTIPDPSCHTAPVYVPVPNFQFHYFP